MTKFELYEHVTVPERVSVGKIIRIEGATGETFYQVSFGYPDTAWYAEDSLEPISKELSEYPDGK